MHRATKEEIKHDFLRIDVGFCKLHFYSILILFDNIESYCLSNRNFLFIKRLRVAPFHAADLGANEQSLCVLDHHPCNKRKREISERVGRGGSSIIPTLCREFCVDEIIGAVLVADHLKNGFYAVLKEDGLKIGAFLFERHALYV